MKKLLFTLAILTITSNGFAYYQAQQGRWISRDPMGEKGGINRYGFVRNNPLTKTDYLGLRFGEGSVVGQANKGTVRAVRQKCSSLNQVTDKEGRQCYNCKIEFDSATKEQVTNALEENGSYVHVQGHGNESRDRQLANGEFFNDSSIRDLSNSNFGWCRTYGCYADDSPQKTTTEENAYQNLLSDLNGYNTERNCCDKVTDIYLFFGPK